MSPRGAAPAAPRVRRAGPSVRSQEAVFAASEGDRWFHRNKAALDRFDPATDPPMRLVALYGLAPRRIAEIGAANGYRVAAIARRLGTERAVAAEVSGAAIRDGRARFPDVQFLQAAITAVPLQEAFDLVIVNFVLAWVDRRHLLRAVAEVDRLVADGGYLLIGDFLPSGRARVPYHHLPKQRLYTYKQDYAAAFLASGLYHPVALLTGPHAAARLKADAPEDERQGVWLLRKSLQDHYGLAQRPEDGSHA